MSARARMVLALVSVLLWACHPAASPRENEPPQNSVYISAEQLERSRITVETVEEGVIADSILVNGRVAFADTRVQHVVSPISGRVVEIQAGVGDHVRAGQALATIESPELGATSSDVGKAQAELIAARDNYRREQILFENQASSGLALETAADTFRKAKAELARAEERLTLFHPHARRRKVTQAYVLRSELDGEVLMRSLNPGAELQSQYTVGSAAELFTVGTIDEVWILGELFEVHLPQVKVGARAEARVVSYADRVFQGTVDWVQDMLDPQEHTAKIRFLLANPDHALRPGMYATIKVFTAPIRGVVVPRQAVLRMGDQPVVFILRETAPDGRLRFERFPVVCEEGQPKGGVAVTRGLSAGQRIATANVQILASLL